MRVWFTGIDLCLLTGLACQPKKKSDAPTGMRTPVAGWGLTHRDTTLIMSDGSRNLYLYTPDLKRVGELSV